MGAANFRHDSFDPAFNKKPCAHVAWLFLTPDHLGIGTLLQKGFQGPVRERIDLFHPHQAYIVYACLFPGFQQVVINLA